MKGNGNEMPVIGQHCRRSRDAVSCHRRVGILCCAMFILSALGGGCVTDRAETPSPLWGQIRVNELMADNKNTIVDPDFGAHADWIELYNAGTRDVDLGGYFLSDDPEVPDMWSFPGGTVLEAGGFLLVWADDENTGLHTSFRLSKSGENVVLRDDEQRIVDRVAFGEQETDVSYGRYPDGQASFERMRTPTPGAANVSDGPAPVVVVVNELMAENEGTITDPDFGEYADWIELYNAGTQEVDLGGYFLTDDLAEPEQWTFPAGTVLEAGGFLLVWADGEEQGLHTNFKLGKGGEAVGLYDPQGEALDEVTFGEQTADVSYGRYPDGTASFELMGTPTPGAANVSDGPAPVVVVNEVMADNESTITDPDLGEYVDWIELYNAGTQEVDLGGCFLTDDWPSRSNGPFRRGRSWRRVGSCWCGPTARSRGSTPTLSWARAAKPSGCTIPRGRRWTR